jgi:hypothetical protein
MGVSDCAEQQGGFLVIAPVGQTREIGICLSICQLMLQKARGA